MGGLFGTEATFPTSLFVNSANQLILSVLRTSRSLSPAMACSLSLPSVSLKNLSFSSSTCHGDGVPRFSVHNLARSRVYVSLSTGSQIAVVDDALFVDYKPHYAFLFPGQVKRFSVSFLFPLNRILQY